MWSTSDDLGIGWSLGLVTEAAAVVLDREEAKRHIRVLHTDDDTYLDALLPAVEDQVQRELGRALVDQTWDLKFDFGFPAARIVQMPLPPLSSVTSITYTDQDGAPQTFAASKYHVRTNGEGHGQVALNENEVWPEVDNIMDAAVFKFVAGYGANPNTVPQGIRACMWLLAAHYYENREPVVTGTIATKIPFSYERLMYTYKNVIF